MEPGPDILVHCPACNASELQQTLNSGNTFGARYWTDGKIEAPMLPSFPRFTRCHDCNEFFWVKRDSEPHKRTIVQALLELVTGRASVGQKASEDLLAPDETAGVPYVRKLMVSEYAEAVSREIWSTPKQEIDLRIQFWHAANDLHRYRQDVGMKILQALRNGRDPGASRFDPDKAAYASFLKSKGEIQDLDALWTEIEPAILGNLERLLELAEQTPDFRWARLELFRELGRFEEAQKALEELAKDAQVDKGFLDHIAALIAAGNRTVQPLPRE